jgi:hypothetical protein
MNAPQEVPPATAIPPLDWRAIAMGAGASLAISLAVGALASGYVMAHPMTSVAGGRLLMLLFPMVGLAADALGGALAGLLARVRGVVHGALAALLASAGGLVVTAVRLGMHGTIAPLLSPVYWIQMVLWIVLGVLVAAAAGAIAAGMARAASRG